MAKCTFNGQFAAFQAQNGDDGLILAIDTAESVLSVDGEVGVDQ